MVAIGRRVYGLGAMVLGVTGLVFGDFAAMGIPGAAHMPVAEVALYASAGLLVLAGAAVNLPRVAAGGALALGGYFAVWTLGLHLPHALTHPTEWVSWENVAENTAMGLGGALAFAAVAGEARAAAVTRIARPVFGLCLLVFGTSEFVYAKFTAAMVPAWLPPSQLAWAYVTGAAQVTAGLAILSGVRARPAAMLLTAMYVIFTLIVHLPRVVAAPTTLMAWSESGVNLVLAGAAWGLADALGRPKSAPG